MKAAIVCCVLIAFFSVASTRPLITSSSHFYNGIVHAEAVEDMAKFIAKIQICVLRMTPASSFEAVIENQFLDSFQNLLRKVLSCLKSTSKRPVSNDLKYARKQLSPRSTWNNNKIEQ